MNQFQYDKKQWDTFWKVWERRLETLPGAKKAALFQAGQAVEKVLHKQIDTRFPLSIRRRNKKWENHQPSKRVKRWQELRVGSGGGYAAIGPVKDDVHFNTTVKDITRYLERGHKIRPPSGRSKRYRPRLKGTFDANRKHRLYTVVPGRMFYSWTKMDASRTAVKAAREEILEWIEGFAEVDE